MLGDSLYMMYVESLDRFLDSCPQYPCLENDRENRKVYIWKKCGRLKKLENGHGTLIKVFTIV